MSRLLKYLAIGVLLPAVLARNYFVTAFMAAPFLAVVFIFAPRPISVDEVAATTLVWCLAVQCVLIVLGSISSADNTPLSARRVFPFKVLVVCFSLAMIVTLSGLLAGFLMRIFVPIPWASSLLFEVGQTAAVSFTAMSVGIVLGVVVVEHGHVLDLSPWLKGMSRIAVFLKVKSSNVLLDGGHVS